MNNYINKLSYLYTKQRNYLSGPLLLDQIYHISISKQSRLGPDQAALVRAGSALFAKVLKGISMK